MTTLDIADLSWRKSARCQANGTCVEVAPLPGGTAVRDSKDPGGGVLAFSTAAWRRFADQARSGRLDGEWP